jgi:hypothetical protein
MDRTPAAGTVLKQSSSCTVRRQEQQYLFYNTLTDELYLMPPLGFYVCQLCDGLTTVHELEERLLGALQGGPEAVSAKIREFLSSLVDRGLLEIAADDGDR